MSGHVNAVLVNATGPRHFVEDRAERFNIRLDFSRMTLRRDHDEWEVGVRFDLPGQAWLLHLRDVIATERATMEVENERPALLAFFVASGQKQKVLDFDLVRDLTLQRMRLLPAGGWIRVVRRSRENAEQKECRQTADKKCALHFQSPT